MKPNVAVLLFVGTIALFGIVWMRGPALAGATVDGGGASVTPTAGALPISPALFLASSTATTSLLASLSARERLMPAIDHAEWVPDVMPVSIALQPGSRLRSMTLAEWHAIHAAFKGDGEWEAATVMMCESGGNPNLNVLDTNGEISSGAWQVQARWWGAVPPDLAGQARQVAAIVKQYGWAPWSCA